MPLLLEMLQEFDFTGSLQDVIHHFSGKTLETCFETARIQFSLAIDDQFFERFEERLFQLCETQLVPVKGIHELIASLSIPYCVASSGSREKMAITLKKTALEHFFTNKIFTALEVPKGKPAPDIFLQVANHYKVDPENCLVIEDSVNGVLAAKAAGMYAVAYVEHGNYAEHQAAGADLCIDSMSALHGQIEIKS